MRTPSDIPFLSLYNAKMFSARHDKPVNQAFWGVVKCYLVEPTEFGPSLLILERDKTDSLLQIFKISCIIIWFSNEAAGRTVCVFRHADMLVLCNETL